MVDYSSVIENFNEIMIMLVFIGASIMWLQGKRAYLGIEERSKVLDAGDRLARKTATKADDFLMMIARFLNNMIPSRSSDSETVTVTPIEQ